MLQIRVCKPKDKLHIMQYWALDYLLQRHYLSLRSIRIVKVITMHSRHFELDLLIVRFIFVRFQDIFRQVNQVQ